MAYSQQSESWKSGERETNRCTLIHDRWLDESVTSTGRDSESQSVPVIGGSSRHRWVPPFKEVGATF